VVLFKLRRGGLSPAAQAFEALLRELSAKLVF